MNIAFTQILTNPQLVGLALVTLLNLALGVYVFLKNRTETMNQIFLVLTVSIALWSVAIFLTIFYYSDVYIYDLSDKLAYVGGLLISLSFYLFAASYPYKSRLFSSKLIITFILITLIFSYVAFFTNLFVIAAYVRDGLAIINHNLITYTFYSIVIIVFFILSMF